MKKLVVWLLAAAIITGTWAAPATSAETGADAPQETLVAGESSVLAQPGATPEMVDPEILTPVNPAPAGTDINAQAAPADFPNVCDGSTRPTHTVTVQATFPGADTTSTLQVRIFAENGGCIPGIGYFVPAMDFSAANPATQVVELPAGRYVYEYSGDGFVSQSYLSLVVGPGEPNAISITPEVIPPVVPITAHVTLPEHGSPLTIVITDAQGTVDSATVDRSGEVRFKLHAGEYFYQYWGDDYPWSGELPFTVQEGVTNPFNIDLTVDPSTITLDPTFISTNDVPGIISVNVSGFRANDEYDISFNNGQVVVYGRANLNGEISRSLAIPANLQPGEYPVVVTGAVSGQRLEATFTVLEPATLSVNPQSGAAGIVVDISGSGYMPNQRVNIFFDGALGQLVGYRTADTNGNFSGQITIPSTAGTGSRQIVARNDYGQTATATYVVNEASFSVSPASGQPGAVVKVTGSGFPPNQQVDIRFGEPNGQVVGHLNPANGTFTGYITIPVWAQAGTHSIFAVQGGVPTADTTYTVDIVVPGIAISPTSGKSGSVVKVTVWGFTPNQRVNILFGGESGLLVGYKNADSGGTFVGYITVPTSAALKTHTIVATENAGTRSAAGTYTVTATSVKLTVSPASGRAGSVVVVDGAGYVPGEKVTIRFGGDSGLVVGIVTATSEGTIRGWITVPTSATITSHTIVATGTSGQRGTVNYTVTGPRASAMPGSVAQQWRIDR